MIISPMANRGGEGRMRLQRRRFSEPSDVRTFPRGRVDVVELDDRVVGRMSYEPGWRWSVDVQPIAGSDACQYHHVGVTLSGRLRVEMPDGTELELGPGDVFEIPPGHDAWVVGDEPWVSVDFEAMRTYGKQRNAQDERVLASIVLTDIVDSTRRAAELGAARWRDLIGEHNRKASMAIDRHRGRLVKTTGDGVLAEFDGAERAVRGAAAIREAARSLGLEIRAGVHTGEIQLTGDDIRGIAVHTAARIMAVAGSGEILVSATVMDLLDGSDVAFEDAGIHELKGLHGPRQLYRLTMPERV
jgi:class 3 adenylate cyclase